MKGICTYLWVVFKKISRNFSSPQLLTSCKTTFNKVACCNKVSKAIVFPKTAVFIKFFVSLTIVNDNPSFLKTIVFFRKRNDNFWKRLKNETKKLLETLFITKFSKRKIVMWQVRPSLLFRNVSLVFAQRDCKGKMKGGIEWNLRDCKIWVCVEN